MRAILLLALALAAPALAASLEPGRELEARELSSRRRRRRNSYEKSCAATTGASPTTIHKQSCKQQKISLAQLENAVKNAETIHEQAFEQADFSDIPTGSTINFFKLKRMHKQAFKQVQTDGLVFNFPCDPKPTFYSDWAEDVKHTPEFNIGDNCDAVEPPAPVPRRRRSVPRRRRSERRRRSSRRRSSRRRRD